MVKVGKLRGVLLVAGIVLVAAAAPALVYVGPDSGNAADAAIAADMSQPAPISPLPLSPAPSGPAVATSVDATVGAAPGIEWGVNLSGLEWNRWYFQPGGRGHGRLGETYFSPVVDELDYFKAKGMTVFRLGFRWERIQHTLYAELDPDDMAVLDALVNGAAERGVGILLNPSNYARYWTGGEDDQYWVGSDGLPISAFQDLWRRLAEHYRGNPGIFGYGLMNEPNRLGLDPEAGERIWFEASQQAIDAIREVDANTLIVVPGYHWSSAVNWPKYSDSLKDLVDPADNLVFEAHSYLDQDSSSWYDEDELDCSGDFRFAANYLAVGPDRLEPYIEWLRANGKRGIIGEIGVPATPCWLESFRSALDYLSASDDVLVAVTIHAAGPAWIDYPMSIEPEVDENGSYIDSPQMGLLEDYMR